MFQECHIIKKDGKLKATIYGKPYRYNTATGKIEEYVDPFNYGIKTKATIQPGDDITLGTEKFKVFSVSDTEIKAMPYYNLKLDSNPIKQATAETASSAGTTAFASTNYWSKEDGWNSNAVNNTLDIDMSNEANLIQQYISDYKKTLENMGAEEIKVQAGNFNEVVNEQELEALRNPSMTGEFWLGTSFTAFEKNIFYITSIGKYTTVHLPEPRRCSSNYNYI